MYAVVVCGRCGFRIVGRRTGAWSSWARWASVASSSALAQSTITHTIIIIIIVDFDRCCCPPPPSPTICSTRTTTTSTLTPARTRSLTSPVGYGRQCPPAQCPYVRPSIRLSVPSTAGGFAAECPARRRYRSIAAGAVLQAPALSIKCGWLLVERRRRRLVNLLIKRAESRTEIPFSRIAFSESGLVALPAWYAEWGLWNGTVSVRLSVRSSMVLQQQTRCCRVAAVGPVGRRYRSIAACSSGGRMQAVPRCQRTYVLRDVALVRTILGDCDLLTVTAYNSTTAPLHLRSLWNTSKKSYLASRLVTLPSCSEDRKHSRSCLWCSLLI